jgi:hypothetical protein
MYSGYNTNHTLSCVFVAEWLFLFCGRSVVSFPFCLVLHFFAFFSRKREIMNPYLLKKYLFFEKGSAPPIQIILPIISICDATNDGFL